MPENLSDKYQVFLQAAQVINQQNALRIKTEQEDERLRLREQYQNELFESKKAQLDAERKEFEANQKLAQAKLAVSQENAKASTSRAASYAESVKLRAKAGGSDYYKNLQAKKLELDINEKLVENHKEAINNLTQGTPTGDPTLDDNTMLLRMTPEELEKEYKRIQGGVLSGDRNVLNQLLADQPGMDINASSNLYLSKLAGIAKHRDDQKNKYLDGVLKSNPEDKAAQFLKGRNFVLELETPRQGEGAVQKAQGDQAKADATGQLPAGAGPGAVTNPGGPPPSPEAKQALETIDTYTAEMLATPEGVTSAASYIAERFLALRARNDPSRTLFYQKAAARSPALAAKVIELINANKKK
jgi:hypothetical protein